jgi:hypothetical protein
MSNNFLHRAYSTHDLLNTYFLQFWRNIYFNDAYVLYKEAISFYKNNQNGNFHGGFGFIMNEYLFKGSCQYVENWKKQQFNYIENIRTTSEDLCRLAINIVNILDQVYELVPKTPIPIITYRVEDRPPNDEIFTLKKGDVYKSLTYLMTSIYPIHIFDNTYSRNEKTENIKINFIFLIPIGSKTYYLHNPFFMLWDFKKKNIRGKIIAHQEYELVFSRGSYWKLLEKIKIDDDNLVYIMQLIAQPINQQLDTNKHQLSKIIYPFNEFKKLGINYNENKSLYDKFKSDVDIKLDLIKLNQKYAKCKKKTNKNSELVWKNAFIFELVEKKYKSNILLKNIIKKYPDFIKTPFLKLNKGKYIQIYAHPGLPFYWDIFDKNYRIDGGIYFYELEYNKDLRGIRENYFLQEFTTNEIYETTEKITNQKQVITNLFHHCDDFPLFYIINLKLDRKIEAYNLYPYKKNGDPFKDYLMIGKYKLNIQKSEKIYLSDKRYYIIMSGSIDS